MARATSHHWLRIALAAIIAGFVIHSVSLNFTQDDAFISYRYARNLLDGEGLVFNPGERVEGYTNFLWIILLAAFGRLGVDIIGLSKVLGIASGAAAILVTYLISRRLVTSRPPEGALASGAASSSREWLALAPPAWLAANGALAYWSISGLETSLFLAAALLVVHLYLTRPDLVFCAAALATLVRPEGGLVFAIVLLHWALAGDGRASARLRSILTQMLGYLALIAPFVAFRAAYYRDILPNPFYAKTGFSMEYLKSGAAYFRLFLKHYGLWGVLYVLPLASVSRLTARGKLVMAFFYAFSLYVILVGGDVLRADRFFLPVLPFGYLAATFALARLDQAMARSRLRKAVVVSLVAAFAVATFTVPRASLLSTRRAEISLYNKMVTYARAITGAFGREFTLAATTIGAIAYVTDVTVIDMLGLTDRHIAKHPEVVPGLASTWRERSFNTTYLLSREPDVILFSTGMRPSAPAEKALFLASKFRQNYYPYYFAEMSGVVFKRKGPYSGENVIFPNPEFVTLYAEAVRWGSTKRDYRTCIDKMEEAIRVGPPDFARAVEYMGTCYLLLGDHATAEKLAGEAVRIDDYSIEAHAVLQRIYSARGDTARARQEAEKVRRYNPERLGKP